MSFTKRHFGVLMQSLGMGEATGLIAEETAAAALFLNRLGPQNVILS